MGKQATQKNILDECHLASPLNLNPEEILYIKPILERGEIKRTFSDECHLALFLPLLEVFSALAKDQG